MVCASLDKICLIEKCASFFVGDAAGREKDHASSDRKWADNIGIGFSTPEVNNLYEQIVCDLTFFLPGIFSW
jgi:hypothetical protein